MAATISINFATPEEVFSNNPPFKKSISAKTLNDVLGGGVVGGGYVQRNGGTPMSSYLTLFSGAPIEPYHAAHKKYVDDHAYTRRFRYVIANDRENKPGTARVGGLDESGQKLRFFAVDDRTSFQILKDYVDVYKNGILLDPNDYVLETVYVDPPGAGVPEFNGFVRFQRPDGFGGNVDAPLLSGTNIQIHVGNKGALPMTLGVASLTSYRGSGIRIENNFIPHVSTGDLRLSAYPLDFVATTQEMVNPNRTDVMVTPSNLSAFPLVPKAFGVFRRAVDLNAEGGFYTRLGQDITTQPPYGSSTGKYNLIRGFNVANLYSKLDDGEEPSVHTLILSAGVFSRNNSNYVTSVNINLEDSSFFDRETGGDLAYPIILSNTRTFSGFKFDITTFWGDVPVEIHEITVIVI